MTLQHTIDKLDRTKAIAHLNDRARQSLDRHAKVVFTINSIPAKNILARKRGVGYLSVLLKHRTKESQNTAGLNAG